MLNSYSSDEILGRNDTKQLGWLDNPSLSDQGEEKDIFVVSRMWLNSYQFLDILLLYFKYKK
jgi:hypothetical protein